MSKMMTYIRSCCERQRNQCAFFLVEEPVAMASLGQAPVGRLGGLGIRQTHCSRAASTLVILIYNY